MGFAFTTDFPHKFISNQIISKALVIKAWVLSQTQYPTDGDCLFDNPTYEEIELVACNSTNWIGAVRAGNFTVTSKNMLEKAGLCLNEADLKTYGTIGQNFTQVLITIDQCSIDCDPTIDVSN